MGLEEFQAGKRDAPVLGGLEILIVADSKLLIPPVGYGGLERAVGHLAKGLASRGHRVTLIGHPASSIQGRVVGYPFAGRKPRLVRALIRASFLALFERELRRKPDVVLSTCRVDYLRRLGAHQIPLVYIFQNPITSAEIDILRGIGLQRLRVVALTKAHAAPLGSDANVRVIGNGVDVKRLSYAASASEGYLAFLGRLTRNKGVDTAIRVAKRTGSPLRIAGNVSDEAGGREFFEAEVRPFLGDQISWIGEISDKEKPEFLGNAAALLVPTAWDEPFGIVVPEALACGTPVIAAPRGSMPELIRPGENGFLATSDDEFVMAISNLSQISRSRCRADAVGRFADDVMVEQYLEVIREVIGFRARGSE